MVQRLYVYVMKEHDNRKSLLRAASKLFRQRGYAGVGISDILAATNLPKGSLYYHFPGGKQQLAEEATRFADDAVVRMIETSFVGAGSFSEGSVAFCRAIARLSSADGGFFACPVMSIIQAGEEVPSLHKTGGRILAGWTERVRAHAVRLGQPAPGEAAALLVIQIEGAWTVAVAQRSIAPFQLLERALSRSQSGGIG